MSGDAKIPSGEAFRNSVLDFLIDTKTRVLGESRQLLSKENLTLSESRLAERIGSLSETQKAALLELISRAIDHNVLAFLNMVEGEDHFRTLEGKDWGYALHAEPFRGESGPNPRIRGNVDYTLEQLYPGAGL